MKKITKIGISIIALAAMALSLTGCAFGRCKICYGELSADERQDAVCLKCRLAMNSNAE